MDVKVLKNANLGLSFILELCLLAAFAYWGIRTGQNLATKILFGVGVPLLTAIFWGVFMAPKSAYQVKNPVYMIVKAILFGLAVMALIAAGRPVLGWVLGVMFVINTLLDLLL